MTKEQYDLLSANRLSEVNLEFRLRIRELMTRMAAENAPIFITNGYRTSKEQQDLFALGRTKPGKIVTNADGINKLSYHQSGKAIDFAFIRINNEGKVIIDYIGPFDLIKKYCDELKLIWGGTFKNLIDRPHIEMRD